MERAIAAKDREKFPNDSRGHHPETYSENLQTKGIIFKINFNKPMKQRKTVFEGHFPSRIENLPALEIAVKIKEQSYVRENAECAAGITTERKRLRREAEHLRKLKYHPNVVQYIHSDFDLHKNDAYILMELCHKLTLQDRIKDIKNHCELKDDDYCMIVILHIIQGLHYIHSKDIFHRDLKPSNILFSYDERVVKISDFGFSKIIDSNGEISSTTNDGTQGYNAPELYADQQQQSEADDTPGKDALKKTDVFSAGLVCFFTLSKGILPFGRDLEHQQSNIKNMCSREGRLEGLKGPKAGIARDLIDKMTQYVRDDRPLTEEILSHPYFWSLEKQIGFYIKVIDRLQGISTLKEDASDAEVAENFSKIVRNRELRNMALHPYFLTPETKTGLFFSINRRLLDAKDDQSKKSGSIKPPEQQNKVQILSAYKKLKDTQLTKEMLHSQLFRNSFGKNIQFYIQVINKIPEAFEKFKAEKSQKLSINQDSFHAGDSTADFSKQDNTVDGVARRTVERILKEEDEGSDHLSYLLSSARILPPDLFFDIIKQEQQACESQEDVEISFSTEAGDTNDQPSQLCTLDINDLMRNEFLPRSHKKKLAKALRDFKERVSELKENQKPISFKEAVDILRKFENLLEEFQHSQRETKSCKTTEGTSTSQRYGNSGRTENLPNRHKLTETLDNLKLMRDRKSRKEWENLTKDLIKILLPSHSISETEGQPRDWLSEAKTLLLGENEGSAANVTPETLGSFSIKIDSRVSDDIRGKKQTWKECMVNEYKAHKTRYGRCSHEYLVLEMEGVNDSISALVRNIRNRLVHFDEQSRIHGHQWLKHQRDLLDFVNSCIPELFPHLYSTMKDALSDYIHENRQQESIIFLPQPTKKRRKLRSFCSPAGDT